MRIFFDPRASAQSASPAFYSDIPYFRICSKKAYMWGDVNDATA